MSNSSWRAVLRIGEAAREGEREGDVARELAGEAGFEAGFVRCAGRAGEEGEGTMRSRSEGAAP